MRGNGLRVALYQFGGNKPAYLLGGVALFIGLVTIFGAFTLEDLPGCVPAYAGKGQPTAFGKVIAGQVVERDERLDGCKAIAVRVQGHSAASFNPTQQAFDATSANPENSTVLVLRDMPARYNGLPIGTKLMALYDEQSEAPFAFFLPNGTPGGAGLDIGTDTRTNYSKTRLVLYLAGGILLFIGLSVIFITWRYPVKPVSAQQLQQIAGTPRPVKKRRPAADPITGERLDTEPKRSRIWGDPEPLPPGMDEE